MKLLVEKKLYFHMCKLISYSIQSKSSQVTQGIHFCFDILMVMGATPPYAWKEKKN